jgi:hypothetical protein
MARTAQIHQADPGDDNTNTPMDINESSDEQDGDGDPKVDLQETLANWDEAADEQAG